VSERSDADLVEQVLAGSQSASRELVERYAPVAVSFIARMVQNRALAEDLAQDTCLRAFQRLSTYDRSRRFVSWFLQVAHNVTVDYLRRKRADTVSLDALLDTGHPGGVEDDRVSPAALAEGAEIAADLERALTLIRPEHRLAIVLHYQQGLSHLEMSNVLGVPVATVKTYLHRGRKEMAAHLSKQGYGPRETLPRVGP
jgi:RNA polymerase sigma-70 factor (ECF subfamily)